MNSYETVLAMIVAGGAMAVYMTTKSIAAWAITIGVALLCILITERGYLDK